MSSQLTEFWLTWNWGVSLNMVGHKESREGVTSVCDSTSTKLKTLVKDQSSLDDLASCLWLNV